MVSSFIFSHSPGLSFGARDCNLARESVFKGKAILGGTPGQKAGI